MGILQACASSDPIIVSQRLVKVVLEGYCRCPDSHDLSECPHLYGLGRHICSYIKAAPGCQKSSPSYKFNSLNFDSEKNLL